MMSDWMMYSLIMFYAGIVAVSCYEQNYPRALYWLCAAGLMVSILWMQHS